MAGRKQQTDGTHLVVVFVDVLIQFVQRHQVVELSWVVLKDGWGGAALVTTEMWKDLWDGIICSPWTVLPEQSSSPGRWPTPSVWCQRSTCSTREPEEIRYLHMLPLPFWPQRLLLYVGHLVIPRSHPVHTHYTLLAQLEGRPLLCAPCHQIPMRVKFGRMRKTVVIPDCFPPKL